MTIKEFRTKCVISLVLVIYTFIVLNIPGDSQIINVEHIISFCIIGVVAGGAIINDRMDYSMNKMHWYFMFLFMFLAPITQMLSNYKPWRYTLNADAMFISNSILIIWSIVYSLAYKSKIGFKISSKKADHKKYIHFSRSERLLMMLFDFAALLIMIRMNSFRSLFIRGAASFGNGTFSIMFDYLFRSVPVLNCAILGVQRKKYHDVGLIEIILTLICVFVLNYPVALSRYWTGTVYLGLMICLLPGKIFKNRRFDVLLLVALVVVFPVFSMFKRLTLADAFSEEVLISGVKVYNSVDFDAYSMMTRIVEYVKECGYSWGEQIRSVIFFFVPRSIWNIKGIPTGQMVAAYQRSYYTNVSSPLMGEAFIDFGYVGVVIYAWVTGTILRYYDKSILKKDKQHFHYTDIIVPFLLGFVVFIMRGSLQSTFLRLMGFFLYLIMLIMLKWIISKTMSLKIRRKSRNSDGV